MKIKKRSTLAEKREQFGYLQTKIDNHEGEFPFDAITPEFIVSKITAFGTIDTEYLFHKSKAAINSQLRQDENKDLMKDSRIICQYLKVKYHDNTKQLSKYGIKLVTSKIAKVDFPTRILDQEELAKAIITQHLIDGVDSVLNGRFNMAEYENLYTSMVNHKDEYKKENSLWRSKSLYRRNALKEVEESVSLLARDLRSNPNLLERDLELWSFILSEYTPDEVDLPAAS